MSISAEFRDHVLDLLADLGAVRARAMFGGAGLYLDDTMFALIARDVLYFKVDEGNQQPYKDAGSQPFVPFADKAYAMSYWQVPPEVMEDPGTLCCWAGKARDAARRSGRGKG